MARFPMIWFNILIVILFQTNLTTNAVKYRIVGGRPTTINNAKYLVSLRERDGSFFCGGTLVRDRYVVTAAHCVKGMKASNIIVHGGVTYLRQSGIRRSVVRVSIPREFSFSTSKMDVAVLKLSRPMKGKNISTIPLCSRPIPPRSLVKVSGWGLVNENAQMPSNQLRTVNVRMLGHKKCKRDFRSVVKITNTMMCAGVTGKRDACTGDSGGPLVYRGQLCGVVSFGVGCGRKRFPGVYTSVNAVKGYLQKSMKN